MSYYDRDNRDVSHRTKDDYVPRHYDEGTLRREADRKRGREIERRERDRHRSLDEPSPSRGRRRRSSADSHRQEDESRRREDSSRSHGSKDPSNVRVEGLNFCPVIVVGYPREENFNSALQRVPWTSSMSTTRDGRKLNVHSYGEQRGSRSPQRLQARSAGAQPTIPPATRQQMLDYLLDNSKSEVISPKYLEYYGRKYPLEDRNGKVGLSRAAEESLQAVFEAEKREKKAKKYRGHLQRFVT